MLVASRKAAVYPGGELVVAGRVQGDGSAPVRTRLVVEGRFLGQRLVQEYPLEVTPTAELVSAIHKAKTGALITTSVVTGGIYAGGRQTGYFGGTGNPNHEPIRR